MIEQLIDSLPGGRLTAFAILLVLYWTRGYWLGPMLFLSSAPTPPSRVEPAGSEHALPEPVRRHFAEQAAALAKLGFTPTSPVRESNGTPNVMFHQFHHHPKTGDVAAVGVFLTSPDPKPRSRTLAFSARLGDGSEIRTLTDTVGLRAAPPEPERRIVFWMGDAVRYAATPDDLVRVYRVHRALVRRSASAQRDIPLADPVAFQTRIAASARQRMVESGWYRDSGKGQLTVTLRGACLSMWQQVRPWRTIRKRREQRQAAALLAEWMKNPESSALAA